MDLKENIARVRAQLDEAARAAGRDPSQVTLLAATKTQGQEAIRAAIRAGVTVCGENRVQELTAHLEEGAYEGAQVHFIGHLQTNKVKYVVGRVALIHSVSSEKLLRAIAQRADALGLVREASKSGFAPQAACSAARLAAGLEGVRLRGLMCIPPRAVRPGDNLPYFQKLRRLAVDITREMLDNSRDMDVLSMGMSGDYADAVAAGSTCVRVGSALFGPRPPMSSTHD